MFKEKFNGIINSKNLSLYRVSKDTGIPKTIVYDWAAGSREPVSEYIIQLAEYFNVSIDYLLGRTDDPAIHYLNEKQFKLVARGGKNIDTTSKNTPTDKTPRTTKK